MCLKTFDKWKPNHILTKENLNNSCLNPDYSKYYNAKSEIHAHEDEMYEKCHLEFENKFYDLYM